MAEQEFETTYNVKLTCEGCIKNVSESIKKNAGITNVKCDLDSQTVSVKGTTPPSKIIESIQQTGRDAIIRGTGQLNSAAVCILEDFSSSLLEQESKGRQVNGLARLIKTKINELFVDITLTGMQPKGEYFASFRKGGDLSNGALSTGDSLLSLPKMTCNDEGKCQQFLSVNLNIDEIIGRSMVVSKDATKVFMDSMAGVIARSAGAWENDKYICSCSGKNIWEERVDAKERGIN